MVGRSGAALGERLPPRFVVVLDLSEALVGGVFRQRLERDHRPRQIVEDRLQAVVEQRQPMLHAGVTAAFGHRLVEQVVGRGRTEGFDIAEPEAPDGFGGQLELGDRNQVEGAQLVGGALALGVEALIDSSVSPKKSSRTGSAMPGA